MILFPKPVMNVPLFRFRDVVFLNHSRIEDVTASKEHLSIVFENFPVMKTSLSNNDILRIYPVDLAHGNKFTILAFGIAYVAFVDEVYYISHKVISVI